jgi:formamidopyrimidine-DNA glycosylase
LPELPEVETIRCQLERRLVGVSLGPVVQAEPFMLLETSETTLINELPGRAMHGVARHGKFLVLRLDDGLFLTIHLGMTGQLLVRADVVLPRYSRFVFQLEGSSERLVFADMRKFGRLQLTAGEPPARVRALGADAWRGDWGTAELASSLEGRRAPLKAFLLDQRRLAGIGNIYADEILFAAGLSPLRPAGSLSSVEVGRLAFGIRDRLGEGVRRGGCSISDYVDTAGTSGGFQQILRAYGRAGKVCLRCSATMVRVLVAGRGTTFCPACQA